MGQQPIKTTNKQIIDPKVFSTISLDDINVKLSKLIDIETLNQRYFASILKELRDEADEGGYIRSFGTVTTTQFTIIDPMLAPNHPVKGYIIRNDGPNPIFVGHNVAPDTGIGPNIVDITSDTTRFETINADEDVRFRYNRNKIRNIYLLANGGDSTYRGWLIW